MKSAKARLDANKTEKPKSHIFQDMRTRNYMGRGNRSFIGDLLEYEDEYGNRIRLTYE